MTAPCHHAGSSCGRADRDAPGFSRIGPPVFAGADAQVTPTACRARNARLQALQWLGQEALSDTGRTIHLISGACYAACVMPTERAAETSVLCRSMVIVIGPTPPGTGE